MQISRRFTLACATMAIVFPILVSAQETDAQKKARQALEQKMKEIQAPADVSAAPAAAVQSAPTAVVTPPPASTPPPRTVATAGAPQLNAPPPSDPQAIEKAREAMRQRLKETPTAVAAPQPAPPAAAPVAVQPAAPVQPARPATPAPAPTPKPPPAAVPAAAAVAAPAARPATPPAQTFDEQLFMPVPTATNPDAAAKARQALHNQMTAAPATQPKPGSTVESWDPAEQPKKTDKVSKAPKAPTTFHALQGPPTGLSAAKEQQLQKLLQEYRADLLTPEQYHAQRAKILAGP
jgi:hypothetical protein